LRSEGASGALFLPHKQDDPLLNVTGMNCALSADRNGFAIENAKPSLAKEDKGVPIIQLLLNQSWLDRRQVVREP
jgi:hypothetical protein